MKPHELLAPAGDLDCAYAAIHYGADAVYLGLKKFSARAEAENFSLDEVSEITGFAHSRKIPRRVFVTMNTLVLNSEIPEVIDHLAALADMGVDAIIVQDLGLVHLVKKYFNTLPLHGSTQLAVHNLAGARTLRDLGFRRVTLARELTLDEIRDISSNSGLEVEVFIHGALCYSYSGLCLYSSLLRNRSGNRGRCNYPCRNSFEGNSGTRAYPFSMKDIALPREVPALIKAGVASFKIEGRKKSPLYVSATTSYYRKLIDGTISPADRTRCEDDIKTIFSRPWTNLYLHSETNRDTVDSETVGHRGAPIGKVLGIMNPGTRTPRLLFKTTRPIERHDGIQIDLPGRPFGCPVDTLLLMPPDGKGPGTTVFEAPAGSTVQVILPMDHPDIPGDSTSYSSSSQAVKRTYKSFRPKPGEFRLRKNIHVEVSLDATTIRATADQNDIRATAEIAGTFGKGRDPLVMDGAARQAFEKLGETPFSLGSFHFNNPDSLFAPVSLLNRLRREVMSTLQNLCAQQSANTAALCRQALEPAPAPHHSSTAMDWSIKTDSLTHLSALSAATLRDIAEIVIEVGTEPLAVLEEGLELFSEYRERIRLALPAITRAKEEQELIAKIERLTALGWTRWEAANLSAWSYLKTNVAPTELSTDWSIHILNRAAALQALIMGVSRFTLSPEDGFDNMALLLREFPDKASVIIYQDSPLFISETCGRAMIQSNCPGKGNCAEKDLPLMSGKKERVLMITRDCRTIVINERPYCIASRIGDLAAAGARHVRADFVYRRYTPQKVAEIWATLREGRHLPASHEANFSTGLT